MTRLYQWLRDRVKDWLEGRREIRVGRLRARRPDR